MSLYIYITLQTMFCDLRKNKTVLIEPVITSDYLNTAIQLQRIWLKEYSDKNMVIKVIMLKKFLLFVND